MNAPIPQLNRPGAGLPWYQHLFLKYYIAPFVAGRADLQSSRETFEYVHQRILKLVRELPEEQWTTRVLVPPQPGLEDSSRFWSLAMTLEHILIVGGAVEKVIQTLARGEAPGLKVSTADVKPQGLEDARRTLTRFEEFTRTCMDRLEPVVSTSTSTATQMHPGFGPFGFKQWYWLLGTHGGIHLRQIKAIQAALNAGG